MKKIYFFLILISMVYQNSESKTLTKGLIKYDQAHVEKLRDFTGYKDLTAFKPVGTIEKPQVTFLECWENEAGDFRKVKIKLQNGRTVTYKNIDGWIKFAEQSQPLAINLADLVKIPANSSKIKAHRYGVTLDMGGGNWILMLFGYPYANDAGLLTLIYVSKDNAEIIFNKEVDLLEIAATTQGYRLIGELDPGKRAGNGASPAESPSQRCEICIEDGKLTFKLLKVDASSHKKPADKPNQEENEQAMSSNEMLEFWASSTNNWEEVDMNSAHELANQGHFVVAGAKTGPQRVNGHVIVIVPGEAAWSNNWKCNVPMAMDTGKWKRWSANRLSYSFCQKDKERIKFFLYKGPINK